KMLQRYVGVSEPNKTMSFAHRNRQTKLLFVGDLPKDFSLGLVRERGITRGEEHKMPIGMLSNISWVSLALPSCSGLLLRNMPWRGFLPGRAQHDPVSFLAVNCDTRF